MKDVSFWNLEQRELVLGSPWRPEGRQNSLARGNGKVDLEKITYHSNKTETNKIHYPKFQNETSSIEEFQWLAFSKILLNTDKIKICRYFAGSVFGPPLYRTIIQACYDSIRKTPHLNE